jgi:protein-S-isoprenylcysteine O-methyltransferase Ste14
MAGALIYFLLALLLRHVPQAVLDSRNRQRKVLVYASPPASAWHLIIIWFLLHSAAALRMYVGAVGVGWTTLLGLFLISVGCSIGLWALFSLSAGAAYHLEVVILEGSHLVHDRAYAFVRHPLRLALAIETFGSVLLSGLPVLMLPWFLLVTAQIARSRHEDRLLERHFGREALDYRNQVPAANLLVGVWRFFCRQRKQIVDVVSMK